MVRQGLIETLEKLSLLRISYEFSYDIRCTYGKSKLLCVTFEAIPKSLLNYIDIKHPIYKAQCIDNKPLPVKVPIRIIDEYLTFNYVSMKDVRIPNEAWDEAKQDFIPVNNGSIYCVINPDLKVKAFFTDVKPAKEYAKSVQTMAIPVERINAERVEYTGSAKDKDWFIANCIKSNLVKESFFDKI